MIDLRKHESLNGFTVCASSYYKHTHSSHMEEVIQLELNEKTFDVFLVQATYRDGVLEDVSTLKIYKDDDLTVTEIIEKYNDWCFEQECRDCVLVNRYGTAHKVETKNSLVDALLELYKEEK